MKTLEILALMISLILIWIACNSAHAFETEYFKFEFKKAPPIEKYNKHMGNDWYVNNREFQNRAGICIVDRDDCFDRLNMCMVKIEEIELSENTDYLDVAVATLKTWKKIFEPGF